MTHDAATIRVDTRSRDRLFAITWLATCLSLLAGGALYLKFGIPPHVSEAIAATQGVADAITWPAALAGTIGLILLLISARFCSPSITQSMPRLMAFVLAAASLSCIAALSPTGILGTGTTLLVGITGIVSLIILGFSATRSVKNYVFTYTATTVAAASVVMLGVLLTSIVSQGWGHINDLNIDEAKLAMQPQKITKFSELEDMVHWEKQAADLNRPEIALFDQVNWKLVPEQAGVYFPEDMDDLEFEMVRDEQGLADLPILTNDEWREVYDQLRIPGMGKIEAHWKKSEIGQFLTSPPSRHPEKAGIGPAMWGTVWICLVCGVVALPLGVGTAIFLEEFRPKNSILRKLRDFVQLNIANLAGVPSIVYGIIGLTAFVSMFEFGNPNRPTLTIGDAVYDEVIDMTGATLRFERPSQAEDAIELVDGLVAIDHSTDQQVTITVFAADATPADPRLGDVAADAAPQRRVDRSWYYLQLPFGRGVLAGGLTLMLVILPIVIISAQESLRAVPDSLRQGALAIGATRWQMISRMTLPAAIPGIMTGSILAMSRAIGEAAPILILAGIVYITFNPQHLMDDFTAMPLQIYNWAGKPQPEFHKTAAAGIIILLAVLLSFNAVAIFIRQKFQKPLQ